MSDINPVRVFVENRSDELILEGVFSEFAGQRLVHVEMAWTLSSAVGVAERSLMDKPNYPVVVVANCPEDAPDFEGESPEYNRRLIETMLNRVSFRGPWHVALAFPHTTAWALLDPEFSQVLADEEDRFGQRNKHDVAVLFKKWAAKHQFNRDAASREDPEFRKLNEFIEQHVATTTATA